ncbi:MAG: xanthine dehydrogenase family protein molybdopterin-binding subunit [Acidobacteria bacterium]|nr:xanthine dehydrogenase family protein molybdopterin-binding subunit [Acidobacteriota bacterium]
MNVQRRTFLKVSAGAGFGLAFRLHAFATQQTAANFEPNAYIRIDSDNTVTLWVTRSEMGQGVRTNLPAALAEELEVDLDQVKLQQAMPGSRFKGIRLRTSGSGSSSATFMSLRRAGAAARAMLISAAAANWNVEPSSCTARSGAVIHAATGRHLRYGELAAAAAKQPVPENPPLKNPRQFRLIGKPLKRTDAPQIVRGTATYGLDVRVPGMLIAVMERAPFMGEGVAGFDPTKALAVPGVRHVVAIKSGIFGGVAVAADNTWAALKGRDALHIEWLPGPNRNFDSQEFIRKLEAEASAETPGYPIRRDGDAGSALANASPGQTLHALYEYPFQAHAPVETMNCVADVRPDSCELWLASQTPETAHQSAMRMLGLPPEAIKVHTTLLGGGFGRRLFVDYAEEAIELSKAIGKPVKLMWTRADDTRHGFFHPASVEKLSAVLGEGGTVSAWIHRSVGSDLSMFGLPSPDERKDQQRYAKDESPWGAFDTPYNFRHLKIDYVPVNSPVPTGSWRAVDYPSRVFGRESFLDEVAHALSKDPLQLRIDLLAPGDVLTLGEQEIDRGRMIRVLQASRSRSGWDTPFAAPAGRLGGRGLAVNIYHADSYMAQIAEVSVARDYSDIRVHRILCFFDCGLPINPAGLDGQVESGITWGLSATLHGKIDIREGRAVQQNYRDFAVMRLGQMPAIETHIIPTENPPGGFGEHPVPPVAPAVANAIFAATGKRMRRLPITPERLQSSMSRTEERT